MTQFHVGQKVVCVDDRRQNRDGIKDVEAGRIYVVRWVGIFEHPIETAVSLRLEGVTRFDPVLNADVPLRAERFRPVVERKTDISQFKAMLKPQKSEVLA